MLFLQNILRPTRLDAKGNTLAKALFDKTAKKDHIKAVTTKSGSTRTFYLPAPFISTHSLLAPSAETHLNAQSVNCPHPT